MAAITTLAAYRAAQKQRVHFSIQTFGLSGNGTPATALHWAAPQSVPAQQAPLGTVATPADRSAGGTLWSNGNTGFIRYNGSADTQLAELHAYVTRDSGGSSMGGGTLLIYDFVWGASGFDTTVTTPQDVTGFPAYTRGDANGVGLDLFLWHRTSGSTGQAFSVSYTNQNGTAGRTANSINNVTTQNSFKLYPMRLQDDDTGVQSIQSFTMGGATVGNLDGWLVLAKPVAALRLHAGPDPAFAGPLMLGLPVVGANAALTPVGSPDGNLGLAAAQLVLVG